MGDLDGPNSSHEIMVPIKNPYFLKAGVLREMLVDLALFATKTSYQHQSLLPTGQRQDYQFLKLY